MPAQVNLSITQGTLKGQQYQFDSRTICIIGRGKDCSIRMPKEERFISRYHCLLDINPPAIRVRDFGSRHGTYVNGKIIGKRQSHQTAKEASYIKLPEYDLNDGDEIKLGNTVLRVKIEVFGDPDTNEPLSVTSFTSREGLAGVGTNTQLRTGTSNLPVIEGYTTLKLLGQGGSGEVYLVQDRETEELLALKLMLPQFAGNQNAIARFLREAENTKALNHPNIVQLKEVGYSDGIFFFTLEYCNAGCAIDLMHKQGGKLSVDEAVPIILQALDGLDYAHERRFVHRDFKPSNLFLSKDGDSYIAKVGDFGLAKAFDLAGLSGQTVTGIAAGTPVFMPRQQVIDFKYAKPEVDVWAAAATLYYMLTGKVPRHFDKRDPFVIVLKTDPVPIRSRNPSIPKPLAQLIDKVLRDYPAIPIKNAAAFQWELSRVMRSLA